MSNSVSPAAALTARTPPAGTPTRASSEAPAQAPAVGPSQRRRRASIAVSIGVTATLATTLTGCASNSGATDTTSEYAQICRDEATQTRVEDEKCDDSQGSSSGHHSHGFFPYFFFLGNNSRTAVPAVGQSAVGGTSTLPAGKTARSGVASKGETFARGTARGGFGGSGKGGFGG